MVGDVGLRPSADFQEPAGRTGPVSRVRFLAKEAKGPKSLATDISNELGILVLTRGHGGVLYLDHGRLPAGPPHASVPVTFAPKTRNVLEMVSAAPGGLHLGDQYLFWRISGGATARRGTALSIICPHSKVS
jgi:hypothetical protein